MIEPSEPASAAQFNVQTGVTIDRTMTSIDSALCGEQLALAEPLPQIAQSDKNPKTAGVKKPRPRPQPFRLNAGDHICFVGNTLADRMQHDGWLEALLYQRYPKQNLVFRDLGFSGDELTTRLRSMGFGTPDEHLAKQETDVVFAFFGYGESFAGEAGLDIFSQDLTDFLLHTLSQKYNGESAPRLVLFSPIAHEDLQTPNLPDGSENNARLEMYTAAMADVAAEHSVPFVDLFHPTQKLYDAVDQPLTLNGIHLTDEGNRYLAEIIDQLLIKPTAKPRIPLKVADDKQKTVDKIRQAVLEKNFYWFNRYRTVDGYSMFGARADLVFTDGQTNRVVMQRELEILDVMTANRDERIWAVVNGGDLVVNDYNTPEFIPVITNKPGTGPNGEHLFYTGDEAIEKMTIADGLKVNLFASEKEFPELAKPVQMAFDPQGRLWAASWPTYPHWKPKEPMNDKLLIFEDGDGDGRADNCITWADNLHCPTGFEFYNGGVLIAQAPDVWFLKDTDGDDRADLRVRVLNGIDSADTHHTANSFVLDPGGALYFQEGTFHHTQVETPWGPTVRCVNAGVFRYEPRAQKFETYVTYGFANPHGHVFDRWGQDIVVDGTGARPFHAVLFSGHLDHPAKHGTPPQVYQQRTRPCPGMEYLSSRHFPDEMQGNLLVGNVIGFQGILQYKITDQDSSFAGTELEPLLSSSDPNFRPSDLKVGADGAIYFLDWQNPIIGHMQHNLRDPSRDRQHGRIYRITYKRRDLLKPVAVAGEPIPHLLDLLKEPEDRVRYRAKIELGGRPTADVIPAVQSWMNNLDENDAEYEHHMLEALWVHQYHNVVNAELLNRMLKSPDFRARAAATRILCYWRDRIPSALDLMREQAADEHPRIRLEAVRAASFFNDPTAIEIVLVALEHPVDQYIEFVRGETLRALDPVITKALAEKTPINFKTPQGLRYFVKVINSDDLLSLERGPEVNTEILMRPGLRDEIRQTAVAGLAESENQSALAVLLDFIHRHDETSAETDESILFDLVRMLTARDAEELQSIRDELVDLALKSNLPVTRQLGFVSLIAVDGDVAPAWELATQTVQSLRDLVSAMPNVRDPNQRANMYPLVAPLLESLPENLQSPQTAADAIAGQFVRIEIPGDQKVLTLAEVEVFSDGKNIAPEGTATQSSTVHDGVPERAIDGNTSGAYGDNGQTHTDQSKNPWWELDFGGERPIESIVVYNRNEGELGKRLEGYTLQVLDAQRNAVVSNTGLPAPQVSATFNVGSGSPRHQIRRAAMLGMTAVRGQETATFKALLPFLDSDLSRPSAVQAMLRIPVTFWPPEDAAPTLDKLLAVIEKIPVNQRTTPSSLDVMQFADNLAGLLPAEQAVPIRQQLGQLAVRVLRLSTIPEQMVYDKERLIVQAGKPVEILFENIDIMPHNFVIIQPGSLTEVGLQGEATATQPGALERQYVPQSDKVIFASKLLPPRQSQRLAFAAPTEPGVYPYVCTYPGHWRRMYGALYVVDNLIDYQTDPEAYMAAHPLEIHDEMLKFNRPRKEWKYEELADGVTELHEGRSFATAKQMFTVASCVACHKLNNIGQQIGPDLSKLDPKLKPLDILKELLDPSARINEKFQTFVFEMESGKVHTGMILKETPTTITVIENPLAKTEPVELKVAEIVAKEKSPTSIMPKGLLDKMTREEILDLISYLIAMGDERHKLFHGGHHKH
ncbi:MAG: PVC-type heme-binding CxxCH protein [Planctomycetaceae bacterium]